MRSLDTNIKADLVKKDKTGSGSASSMEGIKFQSSGKRSDTNDRLAQDVEERLGNSDQTETRKSSRPRSRTFTFNKGDGSPIKKRKSDRSRSRQRSPPAGLQASESCRSLVAGIGRKGSLGSNVLTTPDDCIAYLKKVQKPQEVEVGRIHKLWHLLRNEPDDWFNKFITSACMAEVVQLLYRIMAVEWREDHEDTLLHETLSCLKALTTTSLALVALAKLHAKLFPALLGLLFSAEKKGPSELATRTIIIGILFTYLSN